MIIAHSPPQFHINPHLPPTPVNIQYSQHTIAYHNGDCLILGRGGFNFRGRGLPCFSLGALPSLKLACTRHMWQNARASSVHWLNWVVVTELNFSYHVGDTVLIITYTHYGVLIKFPNCNPIKGRGMLWWDRSIHVDTTIFLE